MNSGVPGERVAIKINPFADDAEREEYVRSQTQQDMQPNSQTGFDVTQIANLPNAYNQEAIMNNINQYGLGNLAGLMGDVNIFGSR